MAINDRQQRLLYALPDGTGGAGDPARATGLNLMPSGAIDHRLPGAPMHAWMNHLPAAPFPRPNTPITFNM
ncbi:hypothetical protein ACVFVO_01640 [Advenella kashmirensis]